MSNSGTQAATPSARPASTLWSTPRCAACMCSKAAWRGRTRLQPSAQMVASWPRQRMRQAALRLYGTGRCGAFNVASFDCNALPELWPGTLLETVAFFTQLPTRSVPTV